MNSLTSLPGATARAAISFSANPKKVAHLLQFESNANLRQWHVNQLVCRSLTGFTSRISQISNGISQRKSSYRKLSVQASVPKERRDDDESSENPEPPQEAVLKAISEVAKMEGRSAKTTNLVMGGTESPDGSSWLELDRKVNTYPSLRGFTAIGTGGLDFVQSMVVAVESVLQEPIPETRVRQRKSAQGRYISVKIGPMLVESSAQVQQIYLAMRRDERMKYFL